MVASVITPKTPSEPTASPRSDGPAAEAGTALTTRAPRGGGNHTTPPAFRGGRGQTTAAGRAAGAAGARGQGAGMARARGGSRGARGVGERVSGPAGVPEPVRKRARLRQAHVLERHGRRGPP